MTRKRISDLIRINPRFLRSVNLERDFGDSTALDGYVATAETSRHLQRIGRGLKPQSGERAWRITGDFGSGKSSFALVLAHLVGPHQEIPKNIRNLRQDLGLGSKMPKLLPVLTTGAREPLSFAVLRDLHAAMERFIDGRKRIQTKERIAEILAQGDASDREVVQLIEKSAADLVAKGLFDGILLVIDELGKSLEFAALHPEKQDIYFLQTLAESASRSGTAPVYTLGLLHQGFVEYAEKLTGTAQLEWAKVSERFSEITFSQPLTQVATLIASALSLHDDGATLWGWKGKAREDMAEAVELGMFGPSAGKSYLTQTAADLYPLHATVIPVLTRFFRRFGQNERSLFSFLLSSEPYALQSFATGEASCEAVYRLADFYDFAANNFAHRLGTQSFRSHWNHIDARIRSSDHEKPLILALLKTIGILNVIQSGELSPTLDVLKLALGNPHGLTGDLKNLCRRGVLFNRGPAGYSLWPNASVNLEQRIEEAREKVHRASPIAQVVREKLDARPIVARRHYIEKGTLRHFEVRFLTCGEFINSGAAPKPSHPADGMVVVVLCESADERKQAERHSATMKNFPECLIALSTPLEALAPTSLELERWEWVDRSTPELKDDRFAAEEVSRQIAAARQLFESRLQEFVGFQGESRTTAGSGVVWFHKGKPVQAIGVETSLQSYLSTLCDELFGQAPRVKNELVNRHSISSAAAAARQKLFKAMLNHASVPMLGLPDDKAPPEKSMYFSVLAAGQIHRQEQGEWRIAFPSEGQKTDPLNLRPALDAIMAHLDREPDRRVPVGELYDLLRSRPFGVRDGLIPLLLLIVFVVHETEIAIYEDGVFQPETEEFLVMRFARAPQTFEFQLCRINGVRRALITELANVVQAEHADDGKILSIVRPLCLFVDGLPDYVKNTDQLAPETLALRKAISTAREPSKGHRQN